METDWKPGDLIEYCGEIYEVVKNHGDSGVVKYPDEAGCITFYWNFQGEKCKLIKRKEDR